MRSSLAALFRVASSVALLVLLTVPAALAGQRASQLRFAAPANGAFVKGNVKIIVKGRPAARSVDLYVDGVQLGTAPPYTRTWNSASVQPGTHQLSVVGYDSSGAVLSSDSITVFTGAPVAIQQPVNQATVSGTFTVTCETTSKVKWIDLFVDGTFQSSSPPYHFNINSMRLSAGPHTITATAFRGKKVNLGSDSITVNVANDIGAPTPTATASGTPRATPGASPSPTASSQPTPAPGGTGYYVDPAGDDANSGKSPGAAWRTVARVNSKSFNPGDVVYFRRGGLWREMLEPMVGGSPSYQLTFATYGDGQAPIISGSDVVNGWSLAEGQIYDAPLSQKPNNVYSDGGPDWGLVAASSMASMTVGTWYWDGSNLYVWLTDGSSPSSHTMEAAVRISGYYADTGHCAQQSYVTIDGLWFQRTAGDGIYMHCFSGPETLVGIVIENNVVSQTGTGKIDGGQYYNGINFIQEPLGQDTSPQILNNVVYDTGGHGDGINVQGANNAFVSGNDVSAWNHNGIDVKNAVGVVVDQNVAHDQPSLGAGFYAEYTTVTWQRNIVYNTSNGFQASVSATATLYNNSIYNAATGIFFGPSASTITMENNAFNATTVAFGSDSNSDIVDDYNDWGVSPLFQPLGTQIGFSRWLAFEGGPHDIAANPMWSSPSTGDFSLQPGSPCIAAGVNIGLPFNGSAPNIGAIQQP